MKLMFEENQTALLRNLPDDPAQALTAYFEEELLEQSVTMEVDGIRLIRAQPLPILYIAVSGLECLANLKSGKQRLELPGDGYLDLRLDDEEVTIASPSYGSAKVAVTDLVQAWRAFAKHAKEFALAHVPSLAQHSAISQWLRFIEENTLPG